MQDITEDVGTAGVGAWKHGYIGSAPDTALPPTASPRAYNTGLALSRTGTPYMEKRKGVRLWAEAPASEAAATSLCLFPALAYDGVTVAETTSGALVADPPLSGSDVLLATTASDIAYYDMSVSPATRTSLGSYTAGLRPAWVTYGDAAYLLYGTGGLTHYKVTRSAGVPVVTRWGRRRPRVGTMAGAAGAAGLHNGTYELRVTFYTSEGDESSASDTASATVSVTNQAITWTDVPVPTDTGTDIVGRHLYVRNTATQRQFFRVGSIADTTTTTATTSVADDLALTVAPGTADRNPPAGNAYVCAVYRDRIFVAGPNSTLRWSGIRAPEAFDSTNYAKIGTDTDAITGLAVLGDRLVITKADSTWTLTGEVGDSYTIDQLDGEVGGLCHQTLVTAGGALYWWSRTGLVRWNGVSRVEQIGAALYGDVSTVVASSFMISTHAAAVVDTTRGSLYVTLPASGQDRNTIIVPFNYSLGAFEAAYWDPMDASTLGVATTSEDRICLLSSYSGQLFQMHTGHVDGVDSATTMSGTFTAATGTQSTITDVLATFDTADVGLRERKVSVYASDGTIVTTTRPRITSNTATVLTLSPALTSLTVGQTYTYVIGGPDFQLDTPWIGAPFTTKRYTKCHVLVKGIATTPGADVAVAFDYDMQSASRRTRTLALSTLSGFWDTDEWDSDVWSAPDVTAVRLTVARVGAVWRARIRNGNANQPFGLLGITMRHQPQGLS